MPGASAWCERVSEEAVSVEAVSEAVWLQRFRHAWGGFGRRGGARLFHFICGGHAGSLKGGAREKRSYYAYVL
jgi:hypothetical protein